MPRLVRTRGSHEYFQSRGHRRPSANRRAAMRPRCIRTRSRWSACRAPGRRRAEPGGRGWAVRGGRRLGRGGGGQQRDGVCRIRRPASHLAEAAHEKRKGQRFPAASLGSRSVSFELFMGRHTVTGNKPKDTRRFVRRFKLLDRALLSALWKLRTKWAFRV